MRKWNDALGEYAGSIHEFTDSETGKTKRRKAIALWRESPYRKTVDVVTWKPGGGEYCSPPDFSNGDSEAYNTWKGLPPLKCPEDWRERARPFAEHINYLVPIEAERRRFIQWLGHMVQRPGELPHTCYLMVATQTGIGRNWLTGVLCRVLSLRLFLWERFSTAVSTDSWRKKFSQWLMRSGKAIMRTAMSAEKS